MATIEKIPVTDADIETIRQVASELFSQLEVDGIFDLALKDDAVELMLDTKDSGIVIGYHGEMLEALQLVLSLLVAKKLGRFVRVMVEVGDYRKNRSEYLEKLAFQVKEKVLSDNSEQTIHSLKSWERRIIHVLLQDDAEVTSESVGEGKDRVLVVKPRN